jgi:hypothetical protein
MEAFESFVALTMKAEDLVVSAAGNPVPGPAQTPLVWGVTDYSCRGTFSALGCGVLSELWRIFAFKSSLSLRRAA